MHSPRFEELKESYQNRFCTLLQLERYKNLGVITEEEFNEIITITN